MQTRFHKRPKREAQWALMELESLGSALSPSAGVLGTLRKFLGSKEHLDWLKIDLNAAEMITVQDYKCTKN